MIDTNVNMDPIVYEHVALTDSHLKLFLEATRTLTTKNFPLSFATIFRRAEFLWLERMKVDLRNLLHTDQVYEYVTAFQIGDVPKISTKMLQWRERRGMVFVTLESDVTVSGARRVLATTTFVVRPTTQNTKAGSV